MQGAAEHYSYTAAQREEAQLQEAIIQSIIEYRRHQQLEAERTERLRLEEAMRISAREEYERQQRERQREEAQLQEAIRQSIIEYRRHQQLEAERTERLRLEEAMRISAREEYERQQHIKTLEKLEREMQLEKVQLQKAIAQFQEAVRASTREETELRQRRQQKIAAEKKEQYTSASHSIMRPETEPDYIVLYNANVPIESIELRQGTTITIGNPRNPANRSIWEIPVAHRATGPFILIMRINGTVHQWEISEFKTSSDKELGIIQKQNKELGLQQIIETSSGCWTKTIVKNIVSYHK
jgi:hypothetical protein